MREQIEGLFCRSTGGLTCPKRRGSSRCPSCSELEASGREVEEAESSGGQDENLLDQYQEASSSSIATNVLNTPEWTPGD